MYMYGTGEMIAPSFRLGLIHNPGSERPGQRNGQKKKCGAQVSGGLCRCVSRVWLVCRLPVLQSCPVPVSNLLSPPGPVFPAHSLLRQLNVREPEVAIVVKKAWLRAHDVAGLLGRVHDKHHTRWACVTILPARARRGLLRPHECVLAHAWTGSTVLVPLT